MALEEQPSLIFLIYLQLNFSWALIVIILADCRNLDFKPKITHNQGLTQKY